MLLGTLAGAIGGGMGQLGGMAGKEIAMKFSKEASDQTQLLIRSALGVATGSTASATTALTIKIISNALKQQYISKEDLAEIISDNP